MANHTTGAQRYNARMDKIWAAAKAAQTRFNSTSRTEEATPYAATEPTEQGNQYVIPGCEKDRSRGPDQADMF